MKDVNFNIDRHKCTHPELGDVEWQLFYEHFLVFPWDELPQEAIGFELGCGTGLWCHLLGQNEHKVIGMDHEEDNLTQARKLSEGLPIEYRRSDFFELGGLDDDSMDFGVALESLHLSSDLPRTLTTCVNKLKPGAPLLIYLLYQPETPWGRLKARGQDMKHRLRHREAMDRRYSKSGVSDLLKDAGLERICFSPVGSFWSAVGYRKSSNPA